MPVATEPPPAEGKVVHSGVGVRVHRERNTAGGEAGESKAE